MTALTLISHHLCPYVQRAAIALAEKGVPFERTYIDLAHKPDWFDELSPLGKVPVLRVSGTGRDTAVFESAVILEYIEETQTPALHPTDPLERARHRAWIEYGSAILNGIARFYSAESDRQLAAEAVSLSRMFDRVEAELDAGGPWFAGTAFSLVDVVYGPIFRYFDTFDRIEPHGILDGKPRCAAWRAVLRERPSIQAAVVPDYAERLTAFLGKRESALARRVAAQL